MTTVFGRLSIGRAPRATARFLISCRNRLQGNNFDIRGIVTALFYSQIFEVNKAE